MTTRPQAEVRLLMPMWFLMKFKVLFRREREGGGKEEPEGKDAGHAGDHADGPERPRDASPRFGVLRQRLQLLRPLPLVAGLLRGGRRDPGLVLHPVALPPDGVGHEQVHQEVDQAERDQQQRACRLHLPSSRQRRAGKSGLNHCFVLTPLEPATRPTCHCFINDWDVLVSVLQNGPCLLQILILFFRKKTREN